MNLGAGGLGAGQLRGPFARLASPPRADAVRLWLGWEWMV